MNASDTPKPSDLEVESDPQPQGEHKPKTPQENDPEIEETQEQPS